MFINTHFFPPDICRHHCLIQKYKAAHMKPTWEIRLKSKHVFAGIFGTDKLVSSTDAIAIGKCLHFLAFGGHFLAVLE